MTAVRTLARAARRAACPGGLALCLATAAPAAADLTDGAGAPVPNTSSSSTAAQLAGRSGSGAGTSRRLEPFFPGANDPADVAALGSTGSPEDDLGAALDALAGAADAAAASAAIADALAILEGDASATDGDKAYRGIPLLNWNLPAKVKDVPPGGDVDVTEVRFGDHAITDTWLLRFAAPERPFTITWHITELGTSFGGQLSPTPLLEDGGARLGGQHSILWPLALPNLLAGTTSHGRFHPAGAAEETRLGTQTVTIRMPPAAMVSAVLDPNLKPGHETFAQLLPATADRLAKAQDAFGFAGAAPSAAEKEAAIARLADDAPEKQVWSDLKRLDAGAPGFLDDARAVGTGDRSLVAAMRARDELPNGVPRDPGADVEVVLMNDEAYVSSRGARVAPGAALKIAVTNRDGFAHGFQAVALSSRDRVFGALDWGAFAWAPLDPGAAATVAAGATRQVTVTPGASAFALWLGDPDLGDQAGASVELDRGPKIQSLKVDSDFALPVHGASDKDGNIWVSVAGADKIARITPADDLANSQIETFLVPGGERRAGMPPVFAPADVAIDGHGIVWMTLPDGNAILRADPDRVRDRTDQGITVIPLKGCDDTCRPPIGPPAGPEPLSRVPSHLRLLEEHGGDVMVFFTEGNADAIGLLRVSADGRRLNETRFPCDCMAPEGIVLDAQGQVWFTEIFNNRIGRLRIDLTRPFDAPGVDLEHYKIPSAIEVFTPGLPICRPVNGCTGASMNPVLTSEPLSMQIDRAGRVWFTEAEAQKLAYVDPALAQNGTSKGITEFDPPVNDFHRLSSPSDLGIDQAGNLYFADEYGDIVGRVTADGPQGGWRPTARQSLPEIPFTDTRGDLWFVEAGAGRLTRISGVTEGMRPPAPPPLFTFETATGTVRAAGLRDLRSVEVKVLRGGAEVDRSGIVAVSDGAFATTMDSLRGDDRVVIVPHGRFASGAFSFPVADLRATVAQDGTVSGRALHGGRALGDGVEVESGGGRGRSASPDSADGSFAVRLESEGASGTVSWSGATPSGAYRTVTPLDGVPGSPAAGGVPGGEARPSAAGRPDAACPRSRWLSRRGARRTVGLLGLMGAAVRRCLGAPRSTLRRATFERWTYRDLRLVLRRGKVTAFTLTGPGVRSAPDGARAGSRLAVFRRALGSVVRDRGRGAYRALVRHGRARFADVRLTVARARIVRVRVTLVRRAQLDKAGRRLAAHLDQGGSPR